MNVSFIPLGDICILDLFSVLRWYLNTKISPRLSNKVGRLVNITANVLDLESVLLCHFGSRLNFKEDVNPSVSPTK